MKQRRSDGLFTKFLIPEEGGFAAKLQHYLNINSLNVYTGRVWYTGTKYTTIRKQLMGENTFSRLPHELAARMNLPDPDAYMFHSFRRTSATTAADGGSTTEQLQHFFGWENASMCQEYVSSSKLAIRNMAKKLGSFELGEPVMEVEVEVAEDGNLAADILQAAKEPETRVEDAKEKECREEAPKEMEASMEEGNELAMFMMDDDNEMCAAAGIPPPTVRSTPSAVDIESTIQNTLASLPGLQGANVTVKVVVYTGNNATFNF